MQSVHGASVIGGHDKIHHSLIGLVIVIIVAAVCVVGLACLVKLYKKRSLADSGSLGVCGRLGIFTKYGLIWCCGAFLLGVLLVLGGARPFVEGDSITMTTTQNSYFSSVGVMTLWGSLEVEDIQTLAAHNDSRQIEFKQSWSKGNLSDADWQYFEKFLKRYIHYFEIHVREIIEEVGIKGAFLMQCWIRCSSSIDDIESFIYRLALDGEDLVSLKATEGVWVAGDSPYSKDVQRHMEKENVTTMSIKIMLVSFCQSLALTYSTAGKEAYSKKIQPQVQITSSSKSETEVICVVTGFYPKPINVSLWKENKMEDVMSTDTLPNGDGTYQIKVLADINSAEQQGVYCRVDHSSLKEPIILYLDKTHHSIIGLVIGITVAVIVCVVGLACLVRLYKKRRRYTSISGVTMNTLRRDENNG
ncbi:PREDICTED: antigen-presenting glycoprotein CD1d-like [Nanorana parkeri]|uniref:antigen-presenting glycoprotein CD1d-like n=1 Tax=Nanorana parkeri TaxID=125878 RepID=UPI000854EDCB|nr:PREDICTED: antigen-presenting glycoprotein CD1d-like [Nanorana parkeri]